MWLIYKCFFLKNRNYSKFTRILIFGLLQHYVLLPPRFEIFQRHHFRCVPQQLLSKCLVVLLFVQAAGQASDLVERRRAFLNSKSDAFRAATNFFVNPSGWIEPSGLFFLMLALIMKSVVLTNRHRSITVPSRRPMHFSSRSRGRESKAPVLPCSTCRRPSTIWLKRICVRSSRRWPETSARSIARQNHGGIVSAVSIASAPDVRARRAGIQSLYQPKSPTITDISMLLTTKNRV